MSNEKKTPADKPKEKKANVAAVIFDILIIALICVAVYYFVFYTPPETPVELEPANVELYRFSDLAGWTNETNETLNVELWLKNTGEKTAREISVFVRCRDQNGTILYTNILDLTWELLDSGETCSSTYEVDYEKEDDIIYTTIEIRWSEGMNSYLKETKIV